MLKRRLPPGAAEAAAGAGASAPKVGNAMARPRRASFFMSFPGVEGGPDGREADADPMADPSACQIEKASLVLEYPVVSGRIGPDGRRDHPHGGRAPSRPAYPCAQEFARRNDRH